jgi:hypothetical protein
MREKETAGRSEASWSGGNGGGGGFLFRSAFWQRVEFPVQPKREQQHRGDEQEDEVEAWTGEKLHGGRAKETKEGEKSQRQSDSIKPSASP